jgi:hypothetical protein
LLRALQLPSHTPRRRRRHHAAKAHPDVTHTTRLRAAAVSPPAGCPQRTPRHVQRQHRASAAHMHGVSCSSRAPAVHPSPTTRAATGTSTAAAALRETLRACKGAAQRRKGRLGAAEHAPVLSPPPGKRAVGRLRKMPTRRRNPRPPCCLRSAAATRLTRLLKSKRAGLCSSCASGAIHLNVRS